MDDAAANIEDADVLDAVEEILGDVVSCTASQRADRFARLVVLLGRSEASRRWLAAFSGSDASET